MRDFPNGDEIYFKNGITILHSALDEIYFQNGITILHSALNEIYFQQKGEARLTPFVLF
ncbi:hypothetical protein [Chitinophaga sp.]|uniref:hypothetical protein n=1 Tax=Chitinophaga sp. TaxID=1869181 RepID=UPI0031D8E048